jgi:hypothetical protein
MEHYCCPHNECGMSQDFGLQPKGLHRDQGHNCQNLSPSELHKICLQLPKQSHPPMPKIKENFLHLQISLSLLQKQ